MALLMVVCGLVFAQEGNARAEALVKDAVTFAKQEGKAKLLEATSFPAGKFHLKKGDSLYLFIYDSKGICVAHGSKVQLVGMNRYDAKDPDGVFYVREMLAMAKTKGRGWVSYKYPDPKTSKVELKTSFVMPFEDLVICAGAYTE
jgi:cytochrome c